MINARGIFAACVLIGSVALLSCASTRSARLIEEVQRGNAASVRELLASGANPNAVSRQPWAAPALTIAAEANSTEIVGLLLAAGARVDAKDPTVGATALMVAVSTGSNDVLPLLIRAGADVSSFQGSLGRNPLLSAIAHQNYPGACLLASAGADVNAQGGELAVMSPLMLAAAHGSLLAVECLLAAGAQINDASHDRGWTALDYANEAQHVDVAEYLRRHGARASASVGHLWLRSAARPGVAAELIVRCAAHRSSERGMRVPQVVRRLHDRSAFGLTACRWWVVTSRGQAR